MLRSRAVGQRLLQRDYTTELINTCRSMEPWVLQYLGKMQVIKDPRHNLRPTSYKVSVIIRPVCQGHRHVKEKDTRIPDFLPIPGARG